MATIDIEHIMSELDDHAQTLRALSERLSSSDPEAAHATEVVAQELWELRKELGDER
ncbi:hypothetical protein [Billgrantia ethanolica]|uniref:Uncharacterized protein n=1 Tax=Billgrantia ethanolica TaxID=2733486 RepID=A0ABS9A9D0_9GAMM|nr:hypothetical protein [Halomonas ethanolica]MCE8004404.1 hypothetical protein [Halomonas ethanolica]